MVKRMAAYDDFAAFYDRLMSDVDYEGRTAYLLSLFEKFDKKPSLLLDAACGTGGFSNMFAKAGIEVIAVDSSPEMLLRARDKAQDANVNVLYLCQSVQELDLYGTVDSAVCCMDSLNHITDYEVLCAAIKRIALFLEMNRLFIFDVNTVYKHKKVLSDHTFVIELDDIYCVWQNSYNEEERITAIDLDFFAREEEKYTRSAESFFERAYTPGEIKKALNGAGFEIVAVYGDMSDEGPHNDTERVIYVTRKTKEDKPWGN